jgi:uncharacterized protein YcbK (DUF882 family)
MSPEQPFPSESFTEWFTRQEFNNFTATELLENFRRVHDRVKNTAPSRDLWANIVPTLRIADKLRDDLREPVRIHSSYRSPAYNAEVGGEKKSFHMKFQALDISVAGVTPTRVFDRLKAYRTAGLFKGGLGLYSSFVHIDTRGENATW